MNREHAVYVRRLWEDMREAMRMYRKFDRQWNALNDALDVKYDAEAQHDPVMRARAKEANLELAGYFSGSQWWREKAAALAAVIQAEKAATEMLNGGAPWERPSRSQG